MTHDVLLSYYICSGCHARDSRWLSGKRLWTTFLIVSACDKLLLLLSGPECQELEATELIKKIKHNFSRLEHLGSDNDVFKVTLSAGIACYPNFNTSRCLIQAADRALYDAKKAGRNRVRLAEPDSE